MNTPELIDRIRQLAGCQRDKSFPVAAQYAIDHGFRHFIETGCYRGIDGDGQSTVILGMLAKHSKGLLHSYELNPDCIKRAEAKACEYLENIQFICGDSVESLSRRIMDIQFAYLDSYDFSAENPMPSQRHQIAEVGAILGKMTRPGLILLDDCDLPHGGKGGLCVPFLEERGWKLIHKDYQRIYVRE